MNGIAWTQQEDDLLKEKLPTHSYGKLLQFFPDRSKHALKHRSRILGIKSLTIFGKRKYQYNREFFKEINLLNTYWSGFSAADSGIYKNGPNNWTFALKLSSKDINHLQKFKEMIGYTGKIKIFTVYEDGENFIKDSYERCLLILSTANEWREDLARNFNITENKSKRLAPPNFNNKELELAYIIGYCDGDGCIYSEHGKHVRINFVSASYEIINYIKNFTEKYFAYYRTSQIPKVITTKGKSVYYSYNIYGLRAAMFIDECKKLDLPRLARKWDSDKVNSAVLYYKNKYPNYFI